MRARGLKLLAISYTDLTFGSRPMRARGLKPKYQYGTSDGLSRAPCGRVD